LVRTLDQLGRRRSIAAGQRVCFELHGETQDKAVTAPLELFTRNSSGSFATLVATGSILVVRSGNPERQRIRPLGLALRASVQNK
jgi:hypothetical protein